MVETKTAPAKAQGTQSSTKAGSTKQTKPQVILPFQVARVRCACAEHAPLPPPVAPQGASQKAKAETKKGKSAPRPKVPTEPWIRGLYVVWCATPAEGQKPDFMVAQTDLDGHLSIPGDSPDTFKIGTHEGQEYRFWFIRHPDAGFARKVRDALASGDFQTYGPGFTAALTKDAQPSQDSVVLSYTQTGKDAKGAKISEPVLSIPAKPSFFLPKGSKLYDEWTMYRLVMAEAKTKKERECQPFEQCPPLRKQVRRLQFHLGALRYLVGDHGHPYIPTVVGSFPNEGVYELVTWNSVLRFQNEAGAGNAWKTDSSLHGKILSPIDERGPDALDTAWGEPTALTTALNDEAFQLSRDYAKASAAPGAKAFSFPTAGLVDVPTAGAIAHWIAEGYRKPGGIMVAWVGGSEKVFWLRERAYERLKALSDRVKSLGFTQGWLLNHTYRDARVDALGAGFGRAKRSIHKTGFAMDLRMHEFVPLPGDVWPVRVMMEASSLAEEEQIQDLEHLEHAPEVDPKDKKAPRAGHRVKVSWRLFAPVNGTESKDPGDADFYVDEVTPWQYDPASPMGGVQLPPEKGRFIDLTRVADAYGWSRIHSFGDDKLSSQDWRGGPRLLGCESVDAFTKVLEELLQMKANAKLGSAEIWTCPVTMGKDFASQSLHDRTAALEAAGGKSVKISALDLAELEAVNCWIGHFGKKLPQDLSVEVQYHLKAAKDPDATQKLLEDQLKTRFAALLKPPKNKDKSDADGWKCECLAIEDDGDIKAGSVIATVTMSADQLTVGDGEGQFPKKSFRIRPTRPTLEANLPYVPTVYFPQTVGEAIGMEWWHYQLKSGLEMNEKDLAAEKAKARAEREASEQEMVDAKAAQATADATYKAKQSEANKKARDAARKRVKELEAKQKQLRAVETATSLPGTWWSMIQEIGWTETGMRAMGYVDDDFSAEAH